MSADTECHECWNIITFKTTFDNKDNDFDDDSDNFEEVHKIGNILEFRQKTVTNETNGQVQFLGTQWQRHKRENLPFLPQMVNVITLKRLDSFLHISRPIR